MRRRLAASHGVPIRFLASVAAALLLALAVIIAGYGLLVAVRREPVRTLEAMPSIADARRASAPERGDLRSAALPGFQPATASIASPLDATVTVTVRGLPAEVDRTWAGVAMFAQDTGAEFTWTPLALCTPLADGALQAVVATAATGQIVATVATHRDFAQHGYLCRQAFHVDRGTSATAVTLATGASLVEFELPAALRLPSPVRIVRTDDPAWLPMHLGARGLWFDEGPLQVLLGAGTYELVDPIAAEQRQSFSVPATAPVSINAALLRPRADRP